MSRGSRPRNAAPQMTMRTRGRRITLAAFALAVVALLAAGASQAAAKKSSGTPCWKLVVNDWFDNGRIDGTYPIPCYTQAIQHIPEDALVYSSAPNDIRRAIQYVEENPIKEGKPRQRWSFVTPFDEVSDASQKRSAEECFCEVSLTLAWFNSG